MSLVFINRHVGIDLVFIIIYLDFMSALPVLYIDGFGVIYSLTDQWKRLCVYLFNTKGQEHRMF